MSMPSYTRNDLPLISLKNDKYNIFGVFVQASLCLTGFITYIRAIEIHNVEGHLVAFH